jgi:hypothetical protein
MNKARMCLKKTRYRDIEQAKRALTCCRKSGRERVPCRYYDCPYCKGFHLTSLLY